MFTIQRFFQMEMLEERGIQEFDAWAASFGETTTDLELQPSGLYKPVTPLRRIREHPGTDRRCSGDFADVVLKSDLRENLKLPRIATDKRQIITAPATPAFQAYQKVLAQRIKAIEARTRSPKKGDDILLSVITDGRACRDRPALHRSRPSQRSGKQAQPDDRQCVRESGSDTSERRLSSAPMDAPIRSPAPTQMIFSDLGTPSVAAIARLFRLSVDQRVP